MSQPSFRYSKQRDTILNVIRETKVHPTADWIYHQTRKRIPNVSLGTVYRNLKQLADAGLVVKIKDAGQIRYDGNLHRHDHFHCRSCGAWIDLRVLDPQVLEQLKQLHGFQIESVHLELEGICQTCQHEDAAADH